jgi:hypothetical protein
MCFRIWNAQTGGLRDQTAFRRRVLIVIVKDTDDRFRSQLGDATLIVAPERVLLILDQEMADEQRKTWQLEAYSPFPISNAKGEYALMPNVVASRGNLFSRESSTHHG